MDTLERLNRDYPCDKRKGYAGTSCPGCNKNKNPNVSPKGGKIKCDMHGPVPSYECEECPYQERVGRSRALNNS